MKNILKVLTVQSRQIMGNWFVEKRLIVEPLVRLLYRVA
jgi:hypothetical protein